MGKSLAAAVLAAVLLAASSALAFTVVDGERVGRDQVIADDTLVVGENGVVEGTVDGDLFVFGNNVLISGVVRGDVIGAGRHLSVTGRVEGSLRVAAETIAVTGSIGRSVLAAGRVLDLGGQVGRSVTAAGQDLVLRGPVGGGLVFAGQSATLSAPVTRDARLQVGALTMGDGAAIGGDLIYTAPRPLAQPRGVQGRVVYRQPAPQEREPAPAEGLRWAAWLRPVGFLAFGLVLIGLWPDAMARWAGRVARGPWLSAGLGALALAVLPLAAVVLLVLVVDIPLALITVLAVSAVVYLSQVPLALAAGEAVARRIPAGAGWSRYATFAAGWLLTTILVHIPWVGGLLRFGLVLAGLGLALLMAFSRSDAPPAAPPPVAG